MLQVQLLIPANISMLFQHCIQVDMMSRHWTMLNQCWNNVVYVNGGIYSVEQLRISFVYYAFMSNVRQRQNNVFIFKIQFHNVEQRWNNVVNMVIYKKTNSIFELQIKIIQNRIHWTKCLNHHCVKSVQIRRFFWSVFSLIRTEYGEILRISPYSVRMRENTDQKKLRIWTYFTHCTIP